MSKTIQHWIDNKVFAGASSATAPVTNPATGEVTGEVALASVEDARTVIDSAAAAFPAWRDTSLAKRTQVLFRFRELLNERKGELAEIITSEHGKVVSDALGEVSRGQEVVEFACGIPHLLKGGFTENASTKVDVYSIRQPLGVVGVISPFNFPAMVPMWFFPIAIATGNTVVLKPSEKDPSASLWIAELWAEAGLPPGVFNVLQGDKTAVDELLTNPKVKSVSFVGLHPDREVRVRHRHRSRQARAGARRREEPRGDPAGRRPRPGRRRDGQRRLRFRRRALHGDLRVCGRRPDRRRPGRQDRRAHHAIEDRRRHQGFRYGPVGHQGPPRQGGVLHRRRRGRRRQDRRRRPQRQGRRRAGRLLARPHPDRSGDARDEHLHRRDLRSGVVGHPRREL